MARTVKTYAATPEDPSAPVTLTYEVVRDGKRIRDIFICIEGVQIAKRQARTWVSVDRGWSVGGDAHGNVYIKQVTSH